MCSVLLVQGAERASAPACSLRSWKLCIVIMSTCGCKTLACLTQARRVQADAMEQALISALPMDAANDASPVMVPEAFVVRFPLCNTTLLSN